MLCVCERCNFSLYKVQKRVFSTTKYIIYVPTDNAMKKTETKSKKIPLYNKNKIYQYICVNRSCYGVLVI